VAPDDVLDVTSLTRRNAGFEGPVQVADILPLHQRQLHHKPVGALDVARLLKLGTGLGRVMHGRLVLDREG